jgi:TfoX/Sxy family transcriptional regulator of competence genes
MATEAAFAEFVAAQAAGAGTVRIRKMFGEFGLYCDDKVVALVCDNSLFLKNLPEVRTLAPGLPEGLPYAGARPHLVGDSLLDDPDHLAQVLRAISDALPEPKAKAAPKSRRKP